MLDLRDKVVVVTGVGNGIGRAVALDFAKAGADVALVDINPRTNAETAQEVEALGRRALPICANVSRWTEAKAAMTQVASEFQRIDVLFNNIDFTESMGNLHSEEPELSWDLEWNWVIGSKLRSSFFCCKAVLDTMRAQKRGRIINAASVGSDNHAEQPLAPYAIAKAGIVSLTKDLAGEVSPYDIRVNAITPAEVQVPLFGERLHVQPVSQANTAKLIKHENGTDAAPLEEIRSMLPLFVSDDASFVTGYCHDVRTVPSVGNPWGVQGVPDIREDGAKAIIEYTPPTESRSWANVLHGGIVSTLMDEAIALVGMASFKTAVYTAALDIRFRTPTPTRQKLVIAANRTKMWQKLINVKATLALKDGTVCATGSGKVIKAA